MYNPFSLEGKTVLVTGASSGIGRATAIECSKLGATLVLTGRNESALQETKELLSDSNKEHLMLVADLRIEESCEKLVAQLPVLDGFVCNAGIGKMLPLQFYSLDVLNEVFQMNCFVPMLLLKLLVKKKKLRNSSSVVFTASISGYNNVAPANGIYGTSKSALSTYMKYAALELAGKGIRCNAVQPGRINTPLISNRLLSEEDVTKDIEEINVIQVDIKRATPKVVEEISQRITPIVENEAKYTLVRSHRGAYSQEYLYVTQHEERITSLVLWSEDAETLSIVELKGNIQLDNVDEIANALKVKGLDRLAYINTPTDQVASGSDFIKKLEERFGIKRDSIFGKDPFGSFRESFGSMDDMLKKAEEMFRDMGPMFSGESDMEGMGESISNGLEVIQENGKTRIKVNAKNSEVSYVIDGIEYAAFLDKT